MVPCDSTAFIPQALTTAMPLDHDSCSVALTLFGLKALVPPLASLTNLEAHAIPEPLLLTFTSQWTCCAKGHCIKLSLRSGGWVIEGEEGEYNKWASFSVELWRWAEVARSNDMEMNWDSVRY